MATSVFTNAIFFPKEEKYDEFLAILKELASQVEANEQGALSYGLFTDEGKTRITVFERYQDADTAKAHSQTSYFTEAIAKLKPLMAKPSDISYLSAVGGFNR